MAVPAPQGVDPRRMQENLSKRDDNRGQRPASQLLLAI